MTTINTSRQKTTEPSTVDASLATVWRLAWPSITSNLLGTMVGIFHLKIISELGPVAVSAVITGHRFFFLLQAIIIATSIGASALVAQSWGAQNKREAGNMAATAMIASALIAALLSLPGLLFPNAIASAFGLEQAVIEQAGILIFWLSVFNLIFAANIMASAVLRASGDVIPPLCLAAASSFANVGGAAILALGLFGFPAMGIYGIGVGSGIGVSVTTGLFLILWLSGRFKLKPQLGDVFNRKRFKHLMNTATPIAIEQGVIQFSLLAFMAIVALYGTNAYAAYGIGVTLLSVSFVIGIGFGVASATIIGQLLGAGQPKLAAKSGWKAMGLSVAFMTVLAAVMAYYSHELAAIMSNDPEVQKLASLFLQVLALAQPIMAIEFSLAGALRGAGDTRFPLLSTFTGLFFGRIVLALVFVKMGLGINWIFSVALIDFSIKASMLVWRFRSGKWQQKFFNAKETSA